MVDQILSLGISSVALFPLLFLPYVILRKRLAAAFRNIGHVKGPLALFVVLFFSTVIGIIAFGLALYGVVLLMLIAPVLLLLPVFLFLIGGVGWLALCLDFCIRWRTHLGPGPDGAPFRIQLWLQDLLVLVFVNAGIATLIWSTVPAEEIHTLVTRDSFIVVGQEVLIACGIVQVAASTLMLADLSRRCVALQKPVPRALLFAEIYLLSWLPATWLILMLAWAIWRRILNPEYPLPVNDDEPQDNSSNPMPPLPPVPRL